MKAIISVRPLRKVVFFYLSLSLSLGLVLFGTPVLRADTDLVQSGEITVNPSSTAPTLTLQGPAFDSASAGNYGLVLSYHDSTSTDPAATSVLRIFRPTGQYQWQFSTSTGDGRLAMQLGDNHSLTLFDPSNASNTIVLHPGTDSSSGVYWNNQRLATMSEISANYVPLVNGAVTIGTSTTPSSLTVYGATTVTRLNLPATTDANSGVIYQDGERFLHSYGTDNVFLGHYAGSFGQNSNGTIGGGNVAVGSAALCHLTSGSSNIAIGPSALIENRDGGANIALGTALGTMTSNFQNIGIGHGAGGFIKGDGNVFIGFQAGTNFTTGEWNTSLGVKSLGANFNNPTMATGDQNTAIGAIALFNVTSGIQNTAMGPGTGYSVSSGSNNILLGAWTGFSLTTGSGNILIGSHLQPSDPTASNTLSIGNLIYGTGVNGTDTNVSTGKIGIGTVTPAQRFHVAGGKAQFDGENGVGTVLIDPATAQITVNGQPVALVGNGSTGFGLVGTGGLVVNSNGNVGIGTASPGTALSVASGQVSMPMGSAATPTLIIGADTGSGFYAEPGNSGVSYSSHGTETVRFSGNGISLRSRGAGTSVLGMFEPVSGATMFGFGVGTTGDAYFGFTNPNNDGSGWFQSPANGTVELRMQAYSGAVTGTLFRDPAQYSYIKQAPSHTGDFVKYLNNAGAVLAKINASGGAYFGDNVGVGTAAPAAKLHVNGDARFEGRVRIAPQGDIDMGAFTAEPGQ